jgi:carbon monoxide dehydrogenase subunit G
MSVRIAAPAEVVWPYLVDWEHLDRWMTEASDFRVVSAQREGVGMVAQATISLAGFRTRDPIVVTAFEPPTHLGIRHDGWVKGNGEMRCSPDGSGTRLDWTESYRPPLRPLGWLGMRVLQPLLMRTFNRDLALLKLLVETEGAKPAGPRS